MFTTREFMKMLMDIKQECLEFATAKTAFIIKPTNSNIGAEVGAIFMEMQNEEDAVSILEGMNGKTNEGR
jgi:hypothetical protein